MCGLAGVILGLKRRRREELRVIGGLFTELLLHSQRRGTDAAGVAVIRRNGRYRLLKRPGPAAGLVSDKLYWRVLDLDNGVTVILGHTRQKTAGSERNLLNDHPVRAGACLGTHNGWLSNADSLAREFRLPRVAEVDSEVPSASLTVPATMASSGLSSPTAAGASRQPTSGSTSQASSGC